MNTWGDIDQQASDLQARAVAVRSLARSLESINVPDWEAPAAAGFRRRLTETMSRLTQQADELEALSRLAASVARKGSGAGGSW